MPIMTKKLEIIRKFCTECNGDGKTSYCCNAHCDNHRCSACGKYCKKCQCGDCDGNGYIEYKVGDDVKIFVCMWSTEYLRNNLFQPKILGDTKTFQAKIIAIIDEFHVMVNIKDHRINELDVDIEEFVKQ